MKIYRLLRGCGLIATLAGATVSGLCQSRMSMVNIPADTSHSRRESDLNSASNKFVREIDDSPSGTRWLLFRDENHPGGPGRLVLSGPHLDPGPFAGVAALRKFVIRAGDRLVLQDRTAMVDLQVEGVAQTSAVAGETFKVRMRLNGRVLHATATGPGFATLSSQIEERP